MIFLLRKTNNGSLMVRFENSIISNEDLFILTYKPDNLNEEIVTLGSYKTIEEAKEYSNNYSEEQLPS